MHSLDVDSLLTMAPETLKIKQMTTSMQSFIMFIFLKTTISSLESIYMKESMKGTISF